MTDKPEKPIKFVVDIEVSLTLEELNLFKKLSDLTEKPVPDLYRQCAEERCKDLIELYTNNIPEEGSK